MLEQLIWHGHASFSILGNPYIMVDPWGIVAYDSSPDVILVTHEHYDHCSPADIQKLCAPHTKVIASRTAAAEIDCDVTVLRPWQVINIGRTSISAVPAYTFEGDHPAYREDLGFVVSRNYTDIYFAGDTGFIPELRSLRCDIAVLPVASHDGVMSATDAAEFVQQVRPRYVVPSHIGSASESATRLEYQAFCRELSGLTEIVELPLHRDVAASHRP